MTTEQHTAVGVPQAIRARYAALRPLAGGASQYPPERAAAEIAKRLAKQYAGLTAAPALDGAPTSTSSAVTHGPGVVSTCLGRPGWAIPASMPSPRSSGRTSSAP